MRDHQDARPGRHGILAPAVRLDRWLPVVLVALVLTSAVRYADRHPIDGAGAAVLLGAGTLVAVYLARTRVRGHDRWPTLWLVLVVAVWTGLTVVAPSFAWTAVPLAFAALEVLPFAWALGVVVAMTVVVSLAWLRIVDFVDPTLIAGPVGLALVTVLAYRTLEQEATARQRLLDELVDAQDELASAQRRAGALSERSRLSREIHDSVGQELSSINLLLNAAELEWDRRPEHARSHVRTAAASGRAGLDEVRRVVRDLGPAGIEEGDPVEGLRTALELMATRAGRTTDVAVRVHGCPVPVPAEVAGAVVRTARGALANVVEHAGARSAVVTLTYHPDELLLDVRDDGRGFDPLLDVRDDGRGFDPLRVPATGQRGRGLPGLADRAESLGGRAVVESAPGEGTTVSVALPLPAGAGR